MFMHSFKSIVMSGFGQMILEITLDKQTNEASFRCSQILNGFYNLQMNYSTLMNYE